MNHRCQDGSDQLGDPKMLLTNRTVVQGYGVTKSAANPIHSTDGTTIRTTLEVSRRIRSARGVEVRWNRPKLKPETPSRMCAPPTRANTFAWVPTIIRIATARSSTVVSSIRPNALWRRVDVARDRIGLTCQFGGSWP